MKKKTMVSILKNQHGVSAVVIALSLFTLVGFVALAVDVSHLIVVKNELQNAADAGALAGAAALYKETLGASVDPLANQKAYNGSTANISEKVTVELYNYDGTANNQCLTPEPDISASNYEDVQRGHWFFANSSGNPSYPTSEFKCNSTTTAVNVANYTTDQLNADSNFINAVQVVTRRTRRSLGTPIISFFARVFGQENFQMSAKAVGYIGFASLNVQIGAPIVICRESIQNWGTSGPIACNEGRMFNSTNDTARWSSIEDCSGNTNTNKLTTLIAQTCGADSVDPYVTTPQLSTMEGQSNTAFDDEINCWLNGSNKIVKPGVDSDGDGEDDTENVSIDTDGDAIPDQPWKLTLPVIICEGDDALGPTCGPVEGFVEVKVVWMAMKDSIDPIYDPNKPGEPGAPDFMHYDIPHYDPIDPDRDTDNDMVYGDAWPDDWPPGYAGSEGYGYYKADVTVTSPREEPIYDPDAVMGDELSIYDILKKNLSDTELKNLTKDIGNFNTAWKDPGDWAEEYPFWTTQATLGDLINDFGEVRWASFVKHFKMTNNNGDPAVYVQKTFYFMPTCEKVVSSGSTGFQNWGILSKYPVLVK